MLLTQENGLIHTIVHNPTNNSSDLGPELFTADGVVLNQRYKMIYQIKSNGAVLPKKVEFTRTGHQIIDDLNKTAVIFRPIYTGPKNEFLFHLRHFVREIAMVHCTTVIRGRGPKVINYLKKSCPHVRNMLKELNTKDGRIFLRNAMGAYLWFKIDIDNVEHNCFTVTDIQKLSEREIDEVLQEAELGRTVNALSEKEQRALLANGTIITEGSTIDL
jgi:hypothetical protein